MTAELLAWAFGVLALALAALLVVAVLGNHDLARENRSMRRLIHPSTRRTTR